MTVHAVGSVASCSTKRVTLIATSTIKHALMHACMPAHLGTDIALACMGTKQYGRHARSSSISYRRVAARLGGV